MSNPRRFVTAKTERPACAGLSRFVGGDVQPPAGYCPHPSNPNPVAPHFTSLANPVNARIFVRVFLPL